MRVPCCHPDVPFLPLTRRCVPPARSRSRLWRGTCPFGAEGASQAYTVIVRNAWAPICIDVSTRGLDDARKYCSSERHYAMNSLGDNCDCNDDVFFLLRIGKVFFLLYVAATIR
ncbi:surface protease GP63 [Trypanosoma cruzi]|nr:surface protease GP63 [Trypanosoma cruzi]